MRFSSYFEQGFLVDEHITLQNVLCNEKDKTFKIFLKGDRLLEVSALKKLVLGMQKLSNDRLLRKYDISYSISYSICLKGGLKGGFNIKIVLSKIVQISILQEGI